MTDSFDPRQSWQDLLQPGRAEDYFAWPSALPDFREDASEYDPINAWWLAELSRLVYRHRGREAYLDRAGLAEVQRIERESTQCSIFEPRDGDRSFSIAVFEGTADLRDWSFNLDVILLDWERGGRVHQGFAKALRSVWGDIDRQLPTDRPVFYAGHSLGGALATLACSLRSPRAAYTFGAPRPGDSDFAESFGDADLYRVVLHRDVVPTVPPSDVLRFRHVGELHYIRGDGVMLVDPSAEEVVDDRGDARDGDSASWQQWLQPAEPLADHTPLRYVEALAKLAATE